MREFYYNLITNFMIKLFHFFAGGVGRFFKVTIMVKKKFYLIYFLSKINF